MTVQDQQAGSLCENCLLVIPGVKLTPDDKAIPGFIPPFLPFHTAKLLIFQQNLHYLQCGPIIAFESFQMPETTLN